MSVGIGLIVLGVIFVFGVALFGLLAIALLPGATLLVDKVEAVRARRAARGD